MKRFNRLHLSLSALIAWLVLGTAVLLVSTLLLIMKYENNYVALQSAEILFYEISTKTSARLDVVLQSISTLSDTAALTFNTPKPEDVAKTFSGNLRLMQGLLDANNKLMSVYIGYNRGMFHQLIAPRGNSFILDKYKAPAETTYIDRTIVTGKEGHREQTWRFLNVQLNEIAPRKDESTNFDPKSRLWYKNAQHAGRSVYNSPYVFSSSRLPGLTCARELADGGGVFGVDVALAQLGRMLTEQKVTKNGKIWIEGEASRIVAYPGLAWEEAIGDDLELPTAEAFHDPLVRTVAIRMKKRDPQLLAKPFFLEVENQIYMVRVMPMAAEFGLDLHTVIAAPLDDIVGYIGRLAFRLLLISLGLLVLIVPLALFMARRASHSVGKLVDEAEKIQQFDFSPSHPVETHIKEVRKLARACQIMKTTIQSKTESLEQSQEKLEMLIQSGLALAAEKELDKLVSLIFQQAKELAKADGGVLYLFEDGELEVELLSLSGESLVLGGLSKNPSPRVKVRPEIMAFLSPDSILRSACEAFNSRQVVQVRDKKLSLFPTGLPEEPTDYPIHSLLAVPIVTRRDEVLGVIQLFNSDPEDAGSNGGSILGYVGSLAAQAAVTLDNRNLVNSLQELFDALIQVVASSIDAKSPYTAGHCIRVPELAEMLARAAHETNKGPLGDFRLETEEAWRQLRIAAWLHDCGKLTTPEYVVDKATKLETINNRIHEIRMRFEVLRRDAEIDYYKRLSMGNEDQETLNRELKQTLKNLENDFVFVAKCNEGGEFMTDESRERLKQIAGHTWMRFYSDLLGISDEERRGKGHEPEPELPVVETLLADKPEHLTTRIRDYSNLVDAQGEALSIPEYEYNRGELYNLMSISRGTLTYEERFKINEHTLSGLEMLRQIPFPNGLANVPEIASSHHETLVGTGYPLKKHREQISMESRILAIADVFEALTASDRPYKTTKTVSEALKIMSFMRNDQHIDADLFDIFLEEGIFQKYAEKYLKPDQIDTVNVAEYMGKGATIPRMVQ